MSETTGLVKDLAFLTQALANPSLGETFKLKLKFSKASDYRQKINSDPKINEAIRNLLQNLKISPATYPRFLDSSLSLDEFFEELEPLLVATDLDLIKKYRSALKISKIPSFIINFLFSVGIFLILEGIEIFVYDLIFGSSIFNLDALTLTAALFTSFGLSNSIFLMGYYLYRQVFYIDDTADYDFYGNIYDLASAAVNSIAYVISILSPISMPIYAAFFILSSILKIGKELHLLFQSAKNSEPVNPHQNLRNQYKSQFEREKIIAELVTAIIFSVVLAVWLFVPGGWILPIVAILAIVVTLAVKELVIFFEKRRLNANLFHDFMDLESGEETEEAAADLKIEDAPVLYRFSDDLEPSSDLDKKNQAEPVIPDFKMDKLSVTDESSGHKASIHLQGNRIFKLKKTNKSKKIQSDEPHSQINKP